MSDNTDETLVLGGNIELSGFNTLDPGSMLILKKIVGNNVRKLASKTSNLQKVSITMKQIHGNNFEVAAKLIDNGQIYNSAVEDRNIFFAVDKAMTKLDSSLRK